MKTMSRKKQNAAKQVDFKGMAKSMEESNRFAQLVDNAKTEVIEQISHAIEQQQPIDLPIVQEIKPRAFVPRQCSQCAAIRPPNTNFSVVYHTRQTVRYCRCKYCGWTWTQEATS